MNWFVVWVMTGKEQDVLAAIEGAPGVTQALCPMEQLWYRREGRWENRIQAMIPGYVFIRCAMDTTIYYRRPPRGGRGLKYSIHPAGTPSARSPPTRGAWIEIVPRQGVRSMPDVAPHAGGVD